MAAISRFECASSALALGKLSKKNQRVFWVCLVLGSLIHLPLAQIRGLETKVGTIKPLTTQFVKRQPRLTKPLELKKRPQPRRRQIEREMVAVKARLQRDQHVGRFEAVQAIGALSRPSVDIGRITSLAAKPVEPGSVAQAIEGTREVQQKIDMSLELLDIGLLNTGKHHAMVIQDPTDKRNIRGFFHLAGVRSVSMFFTAHNKSFQVEMRIRRGVRKLADAMNECTQIRVDLIPDITFDNVELLKVPWIYSHAAGNMFQITDGEAANLGRYMLEGGFFFSDAWWVGSPEDLSYQAAFERALATKGLRKGGDWDFEVISADHGIFHCYYDIEGLPTGTEGSRGERINPELAPSTLKGIVWDGRLIAIHCNKAYVYTWGDWATPGVSTDIVKRDDLDNRRQLQFGINTIIFALTQEGSITRRLMDAIQ
jgi:hypothetical protein